MFKPCPNCGFLVALIAGREASQRCPRCGSALLLDGEVLEPADDTPRRRRRDLPRDEAPASPAVEPRVEADPAPLALDAADTDDAASLAAATPMSQPSAGPSDIDVRRDTEIVEPEAQREPRHDGPSFARRRENVSREGGRRWPWALALLLLALLLALQLVLAQRVELARDARWRPVVLRVCTVLGCEVPAWHEPRAYRMLSHTVRPAPGRGGVLHASTTVRNDAHWPQPPPVVVLSLSDVDGRLLGARALAPAEYGRRIDALVPPGESIDIAFDVREPVGRVEAYDFQLQ